MRDAGGLLSADEVADALRISAEDSTAKPSLLSIPIQNGELAWPRFQFESRDMLHGVETVLEAINVNDAWSRLHFFLPLQELDGRTPVQAIRDGSLDEVVLAAKHFGEHGAS